MAARERLLTSGEVAQLFRVDPKTVTRWAAAGRIPSIRTPGGHRRFAESQVRALLRGETLPAADGSPLPDVVDLADGEPPTPAVPSARAPVHTERSGTRHGG